MAINQIILVRLINGTISIYHEIPYKLNFFNPKPSIFLQPQYFQITNLFSKLHKKFGLLIKMIYCFFFIKFERSSNFRKFNTFILYT